MRHMEKEDHEYLEGLGVYKNTKSVAQGAATTAWAAVSPHFNDPNNGGRYLADVGESSEHAEWAYDEESEEKLWKLSCAAVGVPDDAQTDQFCEVQGAPLW